MATGGNLDQEIFEEMYPDGNSNAQGSETLKETFPQEKIVETAENTPVVGGVVHAGEGGWAYGSGNYEEAAEHFAHAATAGISGTGSKIVDEGLSQAADAGVSKVAEKIKEGNTQQENNQNTDKSSIPEDIWNYAQQVTQTGKYNPDNYQTNPQQKYDYDLQQQYYQEMKDSGAMDADGHIVTGKMVEAGEITRKYDQRQQERKERQEDREKRNPIDNDRETQKLREELKKINERKYENPKDKENDIAKAIGDWRDGKFEPSYKDDQLKKDTPQTEEDSKSAWEKFVENFIEKPLEWLGWKDKDTPESQPTEPNGQGETDPTGSGNGDNDNPNNPNGNPEPLQVPGAGGGFGAGLGNGNGSGTKDLGDPKTPFYDPLLIALQTGGNNTSISVVSHNEKYNACNDEYFFQAA